MPEKTMQQAAGVFHTMLSTAVSAASTASTDFPGLTLDADEMTVCAATGDIRIAASGGDYVITAPDQEIAIDMNGRTSFVDSEGSRLQLELRTEGPLSARDVAQSAGSPGAILAADEDQERDVIKTDADLTAAQLDDKYNLDGDGAHPLRSRAAWRTAVSEEETLLGYWEWVSHQLTEAANDLALVGGMATGGTAHG